MNVEDRIMRLQQGLNRFADAMREQGIHVGLGQGATPAKCCVDGEVWPCTHERNKQR